MRFVTIFLLAAATAASSTAIASVQVIGKGSAAMCYAASESSNKPSYDQIRQCDKALAEEGLVQEDVVATHINRGVLRLRLGNIDDAISDFDRALALDPNMPEAYLNKGSALMRSGQANAAVPLFSKALENRTRKPAFAYYGRGVAHEELGNIKSAYLDYRRASAADPKWAAPRQDLARFKVR